MTKEQIAALCERAGFPTPRFDYQRKIATVRIPLTVPRSHAAERIKLQTRVPKLTATAFDRWCNGLGHAATARFINHNLGTGYTPSDVQKMRDQGKGLSARIRALVRDFKTPFDPKT